MPFVKATKRQAKLRLALSGPSGSGQTYPALAGQYGFAEITDANLPQVVAALEEHTSRALQAA